MFCCSCLLRAAALLIKAAQQWRREHDGQLPGSSAERSAFKDLLKSWQRQIDGIPLEVGGLAGAALAGAAASGCHTKRRRHACAAGVLPEQCPLQASICGGPAGRHAALAPACFKQLPPPPPPPQEENLTEAVANAHKVWAPPSVSSELRAILEDSCAAHLTQQVGAAEEESGG